MLFFSEDVRVVTDNFEIFMFCSLRVSMYSLDKGGLNTDAVKIFDKEAEGGGNIVDLGGNGKFDLGDGVIVFIEKIL